MTSEAKNITLDGQDYDIELFSDKVKNLINIAMVWQNEANQEKLHLSKTEAAIRGVTMELTEAVKAEIAAKAIENDDEFTLVYDSDDVEAK